MGKQANTDTTWIPVVYQDWLIYSGSAGLRIPEDIRDVGVDASDVGSDEDRFRSKYIVAYTENF